MIGWSVDTDEYALFVTLGFGLFGRLKESCNIICRRLLLDYVGLRADVSEVERA